MIDAAASSFRVAEASQSDAPGIAHVHVEGWRAAYGSLLPSRFYDDEARAARTQSWTEMLGQPLGDRTLRVARRGSSVVGFAASGPAREPAPGLPGTELYMIYVLQSEYGSGVAAALLAEVLGQEPAYLWVARDNPRAQAFYRKHRFDLDGAAKSDPGIDGLVESRMVRLN